MGYTRSLFDLYFKILLNYFMLQMSNQPTSMQNNVFRIIFSSIKCKIKLTDPSLFSFVIRIGKISSKYTAKKHLQNFHLEFYQTLEVPFDQKILFNQNSRKEKCQIMLYKFRLNRQKQIKQLVGMASIAITNKMLDKQIKKIRLTNSFDKQAFVQFQFKIQHGQADILSQNQSRLSSLFVRSQAPSYNDTQEIKYELQSDGNLHRSQVKKNPGKPDPQYVFLNSAVQQFKDTQNSCIPYTHGRQIRQIKQTATKNFKNSIIVIDQQIQQPFRYTSSREQSQQSVDLGNSNKQNQQEHSLIQICNNLQNQNSFLMSKIQNIQNHICIGKERQYKPQQYFDRQDDDNYLGRIQKSNLNRTRSPMIKKNLKVNTGQTVSKLQSKSLSTDLQNQIESQRQNPFKRHEQITKREQNPIAILRSALQMESIIQSDHEQSRFFNKKSAQQRKFLQAQNLYYMNQNLEISFPLKGTIAGQRFSSKFQSMQINPVVTVTYVPPVNCDRDQEYFQHEQSIINKSISPTQQYHSKSYSKFEAKKKYQLVGAIKNSDQSKILGFDQQQNSRVHEKKKKHQEHYSYLQQQRKSNYMQQQNNNPRNKNADSHNQYGNNMLHLLKVDQQEGIFVININGGQKDKQLPNNQSKQNLPAKLRVTLQQIDSQTETKFRKNERILKIANQQLLKQNIRYKQQRKHLQKQLVEKKQLSQSQFYKLKDQIQTLKVQGDKQLKQMQKSKQMLNDVTSKFEAVQGQNTKLKKSMKEQKQLYQYYFKISNVNDQKQKQKQLDRSLYNNSLTSKTLSNKQSQDNNSSKHVLDKDSGKQVMMTTNKKPFLIQKITNKPVLIQKIKNQPNAQTYSPRKCNDNSRIFSGTVSNPGQKSSKAVSMLKNHHKPNAPKQPQSSVFDSMTNSNHTNKYATTQPSFAGRELLHTPAGGLSGTGQTIVQK